MQRTTRAGARSCTSFPRNDGRVLAHHDAAQLDEEVGRRVHAGSRSTWASTLFDTRNLSPKWATRSGTRLPACALYPLPLHTLDDTAIKDMLVTTCLMDACSLRLRGRCLHNSRIWKKGHTRCCSAGSCISCYFFVFGEPSDVAPLMIAASDHAHAHTNNARSHARGEHHGLG